MYLEYFGFNKEPFSIVPNPHMLFPSPRHQEALGYLQYGLNGNGGFVLLTGEVGTGKTMVSRTVLSELPDDINVAYILNPTLNKIQLLQSICEAFELTLTDKDDHKCLTDTLQRFLIDQHQQSKRCVLVIDEAQHLSVDALEQLRLFTNLETNERKLLQVVLLGQPELQEKLQRRELRQLAQRITARYHLMPFKFDETKAYIEHRLRLSGCGYQVFSSSAITYIHRRSKGTPRLINLIADRALMAAFVTQTSKVNKKLCKSAADEVLGNEQISSSNWPIIGLVLLAVGALVSWSMI